MAGRIMSTRKFIKIYNGKTKNVYSVRNEPDRFAIHFKDFGLHKHGVWDSGGNESKKTYKNKGKHCLFVTDYFFRLFEKHGIKTHYIKKLNDQNMLVLKTKSIPIEFILRNYAFGTYLDRFPSVKKYKKLNGLIEFTLKSDVLGDPLLTRAECLKYVTKDELARIVRAMRKMNAVAKTVCRKLKITLIDFKAEFGRRGKELLMIDDFSTDTARFLKGRKLLTPFQLSREIQKLL